MKRKGGKTDQKKKKKQNKNQYEDNYQLSIEEKKTQPRMIPIF